MNIGGWIAMIVSVSFVVVLTVWCFYRVLTTPTHPVKPPDTLGG